MTKFITRTVACLLIPCLMADSSFARLWMSPNRQMSTTICSIPWTSQALQIPSYESRLPNQSSDAPIKEMAAAAMRQHEAEELPTTAPADHYEHARQAAGAVIIELQKDGGIYKDFFSPSDEAVRAYVKEYSGYTIEQLGGVLRDIVASGHDPYQAGVDLGLNNTELLVQFVSGMNDPMIARHRCRNTMVYKGIRERLEIIRNQGGSGSVDFYEKALNIELRAHALLIVIFSPVAAPEIGDSSKKLTAIPVLDAKGIMQQRYMGPAAVYDLPIYPGSKAISLALKQAQDWLNHWGIYRGLTYDQLTNLDDALARFKGIKLGVELRTTFKDDRYVVRRDRKTKKYVAYAESEDPEYQYVVLRPTSAASHGPQPWIPQQGGSLGVTDSNQVANWLYQGVKAHLGMTPHPQERFLEIVGRYASITIEKRPNTFEEQMVFGKGPGGLLTATVFLDPSLFQPGMETRLQGALFEAAGWLVHGIYADQESLTAQTWLSLLREIHLTDFLSAFGDLKIGQFGVSKEIQNLSDIFRRILKDTKLTESSFTEIVRSSLPFCRALLPLFESIVQSYLLRLDEEFPGARRENMHLMPIPSRPPAAAPGRRISRRDAIRGMLAGLAAPGMIDSESTASAAISKTAGFHFTDKVAKDAITSLIRVFENIPFVTQMLRGLPVEAWQVGSLGIHQCVSYAVQIGQNLAEWERCARIVDGQGVIRELPEALSILESELAGLRVHLSGFKSPIADSVMAIVDAARYHPEEVPFRQTVFSLLSRAAHFGQTIDLSEETRLALEAMRGQKTAGAIPDGSSYRYGEDRLRELFTGWAGPVLELAEAQMKRYGLDVGLPMDRLFEAVVVYGHGEYGEGNNHIENFVHGWLDDRLKDGFNAVVDKIARQNKVSRAQAQQLIESIYKSWLENPSAAIGHIEHRIEDLAHQVVSSRVEKRDPLELLSERISLAARVRPVKVRIQTNLEGNPVVYRVSWNRPGGVDVLSRDDLIRLNRKPWGKRAQRGKTYELAVPAGTASETLWNWFTRRVPHTEDWWKFPANSQNVILVELPLVRALPAPATEKSSRRRALASTRRAA